MDLYTKDIQSIFQVWISIPRLYKVYSRYGLIYQGYTKYIPGMDFNTKGIKSIFQVWISIPRVYKVYSRYGLIYQG